MKRNEVEFCKEVEFLTLLNENNNFIKTLNF